MPTSLNILRLSLTRISYETAHGETVSAVSQVNKADAAMITVANSNSFAATTGMSSSRRPEVVRMKIA